MKMSNQFNIKILQLKKQQEDPPDNKIIMSYILNLFNKVFAKKNCCLLKRMKIHTSSYLFNLSLLRNIEDLTRLIKNVHQIFIKNVFQIIPFPTHLLTIKLWLNLDSKRRKCKGIGGSKNNILKFIQCNSNNPIIIIILKELG